MVLLIHAQLQQLNAIPNSNICSHTLTINNNHRQSLSINALSKLLTSAHHSLRSHVKHPIALLTS